MISIKIRLLSENHFLNMIFIRLMNGLIWFIIDCYLILNCLSGVIVIIILFLFFKNGGLMRVELCYLLV